jgi:thiamine biosynthesis lipoprotein
MLKRKISQEMPLMSTIINITVISDKPTIFTNDKIDEAFSKFKYVVKKFTRFDKNSDLSKLNENHKSFPYKVDKELFDLIKFSLNLAEITNGQFDPTIIDLLETYGYGEGLDFKELENQKLMEEIQKVVLLRNNFRKIKLNESSLEIQLAKGQKIDLGGLGKGYAIDLAYDLLDKYFDSFLINAGGDIRTKGKNLEDQSWLIALEKEPIPNTSAHLSSWGNINLSDKALAASGYWYRKIKFFHHLLNPVTGLPVNDTTQVFVISDTALQADAWATALFVVGKDAITSLKTQLKERNIEVMIVDNKGNTHKTDKFPYISTG